jgi:hypothetical protein
MSVRTGEGYYPAPPAIGRNGTPIHCPAGVGGFFE